jgi:hypothetical protein
MKPVCFFATYVLLQVGIVKRKSVYSAYDAISNYILKKLGKKKDTIAQSPKPPNEVYIENQTHRFLKSYESTEDFNANISDCFYTKEALKEALIEVNNPLEVEWKRRILYESTPRGNITMYYDPYKLGFVYYSDTNTISPTLLNAAAMKYCLVYRCRDLFVDNSVTPENSHSALIPVHYIEPPKKKSTNDSNNQSSKSTTNAVFAKFKNYSNQTDKENPNSKTGSKQDDKSIITQSMKDICKNRFIYMGKMCNIGFLQPVKKYINTMNGFSSQHIDDLNGETKLQSHVMSYTDYKRSTKTPTA